MTAPRWSLDGRMLWFTLWYIYRRRKPYKPSHVLAEVVHFLHCVLHNLLLRHRSPMTYHAFHRLVRKTGTIDLVSQKVLLSEGVEYGVTWLPRTHAETKA